MQIVGVFFSLLILLASAPKCIAAAIDEDYLRCVVRIDNEEGKSGTGFFFQYNKPGSPLDNHVFLVTNKHVLSETEEAREKATKIVLHMNKYVAVGKISQTLMGILIKVKGTNCWRGHPNPAVDVLAFDVSEFALANASKMPIKVLGKGNIADAEYQRMHGIGVGTDVIVLGYPQGILPGSTSYPLARQGLIASDPDGEIIQPGAKRPIQAFYIDCPIIPGSSGSPVFTKPTNFSYDFSQTPVRTSIGTFPSMLIGIVNAAPCHLKGKEDSDFQYWTNLGQVFRYQTIDETIEEFAKGPCQ